MVETRLAPLTEDEGLGLFEWRDPRAKGISNRGHHLLPAFFDRLSQEERLPDVMNSMYAKKKTSKVFRHIGLENLGQRSKGVDQKQMLDLNRRKLEAVGPAGTSMKGVLKDVSEEGAQFMADVVEYAESCLVPEVLRELSGRLGFDLTQFHSEAQFGYRFLDYPARRHCAGGPMRCGDHTDTSTITIVIQCGVPGLEAEDRSGKWFPIPADRIVVMLGSVAQILSNDVLQAPVHRVVDAPAQDGCIPRRNSVVVFVDADPQTPLQPHVQRGHAPRFRADLPLPGDLKTRLYQGVAVIDDFRRISSTSIKPEH